MPETAKPGWVCRLPDGRLVDWTHSRLKADVIAKINANLPPHRSWRRARAEGCAIVRAAYVSGKLQEHSHA